MSTSANVIKYRIERASVLVGRYRQNLLCKTNWNELLKFEPLEDHMIIPHGYDEDEVYWEADPINLKDFMAKVDRKG